ncbi:IclR family transcriptional regulator [Parapusillimonas sp. JC17]|uniref:IclR family transcriptional regulator n=1 Tax=Parapusillimonas sp. JC17 TaxID=3445768 RepID=UPI003FA14252
MSLSLKPSKTDSPESPYPSRDTVHAVMRALAVLDAFHVDEQTVSLSELSRRLGMGKSTVLRTARTLAGAGYLAQTEDGRWRLGPAAGWLGVRYQTSFDVNNVIDALLRHLHGVTGETAAFFVREGNWRSCVARVDRLSMARVHVRVGEKLPLDKGASGRVLLAFSGQQGAPYEQIRRKGFYLSMGERDPTMASIAIPVFRASRELFGALCISGQAERLTFDVLNQHLKPLIEAGAELGRALSANRAMRAQ